MCHWLRHGNQVSFRGITDSDPAQRQATVANDHFGPRPDDQSRDDENHQPHTTRYSW